MVQKSKVAIRKLVTKLANKIRKETINSFIFWRYEIKNDRNKTNFEKI